MIKHISEVTGATRDYIDKRRKGLITSLRTGYPKLDSAGIDGIEWGSTVTVGARPSIGKSIFTDLLLDGSLKSNAQDYDILDFNWEMAALVQLIRKVSTSTGKSYKEICSAEGILLGDSEMDSIEEVLELYNKLPIYFEEEAKTPKEFAACVREFKLRRKRETGDPNRKLVVRVDHTLLAKMSASDGDRVQMLLNLLGEANVIKKDGDVIFIFLTQLNREIEDRQEDGSDRAFPKQSDVFGGDATSMFSEMMILLNSPAKYGINAYGKGRSSRKVEPNDLYAHIVKNRNGEPNLVVQFKTNFSKMTMVEW